MHRSRNSDDGTQQPVLSSPPSKPEVSCSRTTVPATLTSPLGSTERTYMPSSLFPAPRLSPLHAAPCPSSWSSPPNWNPSPKSPHRSCFSQNQLFGTTEHCAVRIRTPPPPSVLLETPVSRTPGDKDERDTVLALGGEGRSQGRREGGSPEKLSPLKSH